MAELTLVAKVSDVKAGDSLCVDCEGERVAIFNDGGKLYAISDQCPHAGGPLSGGFIENGRVTCPWHGWSFDLDPDKTDPPNDMICKYRVHIEGDDVKLEKVSG